MASLPAQQRIIIRTVDMQLTVSDVAAAVDQVAALAGRSGGWVVSSDRSARHGGYISIRVPAGSLDSAVVRLRELALEVESEISTSQDVTDEYVDIQSRLKGLRATEDRLLEIMQQADKVEDALNVQLELSNLQTRIEQIEGRIKYLEQTSAYSLINIYLQASPLALPVNAGTDKTFAVGATARFRATFQPPEGIENFSWRWDFGDGSRPVEGSASAPTTNAGERITATVTHTYNDERDSPYIVEFTLTGTGESGLAEGEDTFIATVIKTPEIAVFAGESQVAEENEIVEFSGSFTRPEGLRDFRYRWDFGDGSPAVEGVPAQGETQVAVSHVYPNHRPNEYIVTLTVTAESDAGGVETAGYLGVHVRESESLVISGWSLADAGRSSGSRTVGGGLRHCDCSAVAGCLHPGAAGNCCNHIRSGAAEEAKGQQFLNTAFAPLLPAIMASIWQGDCYEIRTFLPDSGAQALGRGERGPAHLGGAGPDCLRRGDGLRQRLVLGASFPPGMVAQQRPRPYAGGGHAAYLAHPHGHRSGAGADTPPAAYRGAYGYLRHPQQGPCRRGPGPHRLSLPANALWNRPGAYPGDVGGVRRSAAPHLD